ncbi:hypothetical protein ILUMI_13930 [Ignelater luminosus]|uniref:DUF4817 domain-containing protein n=1 Tax=Ignelater luminosus TaxID=2038154 RepID=A0A8K0GAG3_IGNLU|nr:hypothetical protein ILUMI_13930 [Ignelater luminosus]
MERYTTEQRTKIIAFYFRNQRSIVLMRRAYRRYFSVGVLPTVPTVNRLVANFRQRGSVRNLTDTGRPRMAQRDDNIQHVSCTKLSTNVVLTAHTAQNAIAVLRDIFDQSIISRNSNL